MRFLLPVFLLMQLAISSCTQREEEQEPDYDHMVMTDEDGFSPDDQERDRKVIVDDPPDPQELIIL